LFSCSRSSLQDLGFGVSGQNITGKIEIELGDSTRVGRSPINFCLRIETKVAGNLRCPPRGFFFRV
jgi:hypothetical protein